MSQNIEIEYKNLLTETEFNFLLSYFKLEAGHFKKQVNHYFDTPSFTLKDSGSALRIREKDHEFELTLKQPAQQGLLETNQILTDAQKKEALITGKLPEGEVKDAVSSFIHDSEQLQYFGSLTTMRAEFRYKEGLLVLDHSFYFNTEDFELEYEVTDASEGLQIFSNLLTDLNIPVRHTDNKIKRFYAKKYPLL
ncbi:CYTH domain-containing protein [Mesobacillus subterraneus]|uniref:CYTH domain-containing protein n=1 Tax=Mesobacillus subterraneus TaxID=285983 RepID=A0A0D6Z4H6_9BACI|nr:CYTH domain-containing protein [Mesobacillus subterraneus]KIY20614.1 hypothetical protein UB32_18245 [Mesobacillus subterraneus]